MLKLNVGGLVFPLTLAGLGIIRLRRGSSHKGRDLPTLPGSINNNGSESFLVIVGEQLLAWCIESSFPISSLNSQLWWVKLKLTTNPNAGNTFTQGVRKLPNVPLRHAPF